ncbi:MULTISPECIES: magnesium transporter CorA family protein [unclassified Cupriavidus]|uniref:magnesium transporter CorA family protein n=1 Tax=unclassified Cupriavidus TaxID=2640874 RepID=UPI0002918839|nr:MULTISPECIES: magnesium transporter CorA family protein [unclassified Cupriavidus]ESH94241.1 magnesium transporter [Cupriavidus sp. HPC(L)]MCD9122230.1 magnesium transporter CorA family protein [Cupriavidus sp. UGS-1]
MQLLGFSASQVHPLDSLEGARAFLAEQAAPRFVWVDCTLAEVSAAPAAWRDQLQTLTGAPVLDLHLADATNAAHPSFFDTTHAYDMVIFRKLTFETSRLIAEAGSEGPAPVVAKANGSGAETAAVAGAAGAAATAGTAINAAKPRRHPPGFLPALARIDTQPVSFFVFDHVLATVRPGQSRTIEQVRQRLLELSRAPRPEVRGNGGTALVHGIRPPTRPEDLMLRLLNAMVDRYLDLRAPLTRQLDRWQRALLNARSGFSSWEGLLDARIQLRRLEHLCEEQRDALQEFRDSLLDNTYSDPAGGIANDRDEVLLVRINDVMEHILRVLAHARRLEDSIESAVQIHFSAVAHRTNRTMRMLTMITALFMPLTLITGVFGMNFERMPWLQEPSGFWWSIGLMGAVVAGIAAMWAVGRWLLRE